MAVCVCQFFSCLFESDFVFELSEAGNERAHMEVRESVNGFTVKLDEKEASGDPS